MTSQTTFAPGYVAFCKPVRPVRRQKASVGQIKQCLQRYGQVSAVFIAQHVGLSRNYVIGVLRDLREAGQVKRVARGIYQWAET